MTHTIKIVELPGYSDPVWYNPKGISCILSLGLLQKNHPVAYNIQNGNEFVVHSPQRPTFNIIKDGFFNHDMRHLLKKKDTHIMLNDLHSPIPHMQDKNKVYTARDIKQADCARLFQHITGQSKNIILHAVDNNILENLPILREDVRTTEDIYGKSIPHLKSKTVWCKIQHVEPINITSVPKTILYNYKEVTICCYLMHINGIILLNTISRYIVFTIGSMIKNRKIENIVDGIIQVHKLYLQSGFKITHMQTDC